jgi:uncharacterized membrane protein
MTTEQAAAQATPERTFPLTLRTAIIILLFIAIGVSGYLSYLKANDANAVCVSGGKFDCHTVLNSVYSELGGIPIAWLGLATNLIMLTIITLQDRIPFLEQFGVTLFFGVILFAFGFSVYLVYVQAFLIKAYCPWCLSHEALMTLIFIASIFRLRNAMREAD